MGVALRVKLRWPLAAVGPSDAVVEILDEARGGIRNLSCDLSQLPTVLLPPHEDVITNEAAIELFWLVSDFEAIGNMPLHLRHSAATTTLSLSFVLFLPTLFAVLPSPLPPESIPL